MRTRRADTIGMDTPDIDALLSSIVADEPLARKRRRAVAAFLRRLDGESRALLIVDQPDGSVQFAAIRLDRAHALGVAIDVIQKLYPLDDEAD